MSYEPLNKEDLDSDLSIDAMREHFLYHAPQLSRIPRIQVYSWVVNALLILCNILFFIFWFTRETAENCSSRDSFHSELTISLLLSHLKLMVYSTKARRYRV